MRPAASASRIERSDKITAADYDAPLRSEPTDGSHEPLELFVTPEFTG